MTNDIRLDELIASLKALNTIIDWGLPGITLEQKKEIINKVLKGFVIYSDEPPNDYFLKCRVELQFDIPVTTEQIAYMFQVFSRQR